MNVEITEGDKQLVACLLWEYSFPAMSYTAIMEKILIPFFADLNLFQDMNYLDFALSSLLNYCSDEELSSWAQNLFRILTENLLSVSYANEDSHREQIKYLSLILKLIRHHRILASWLQSETIFTDLEYLYFTQISSKSDLERIYPYIHYPNTIFQESSKAMFYKNMASACRRCSQSQDLLFELTRIFMDETAIIRTEGGQVVPRLVIISFIDHLIKKNIKYVQELVLLFHPLTSI